MTTTATAPTTIDYQRGSATIDADGHVNETGHLGDYIDPEHVDMLSLPPGTVRKLTEPPEGFRMLATWNPEVLGHLAIPGGSDGTARLADMDREGIDAAVLYPTLLLEWREDPAGFGALCRAYNNWLRDYCAADPNRLFGVGAVPLQDAAAVVRRTVIHHHHLHRPVALPQRRVNRRAQVSRAVVGSDSNADERG